MKYPQLDGIDSVIMYRNKSVAVVVPAFNEAKQISKVIRTMPSLVDQIVVIDDKSTDGMAAVVEDERKSDLRVTLIRHETNQGVGGAIATGYKWARDNGVDVAVVMAGDGQMDPNDLENILDPVASGRVGYSKGNRLIYANAYRDIPKIRFFGNTVLSFLTKIASGYWHVADSQTGYTAIGRKPLEIIDWDAMYKRYGQPNDLLVRLNIHDFKVADVPIRPVYGVGERSKLKVRRVVFTISLLLLRRFLWRLREKYVVRDFHPLVFFYVMSLGFGILSAILLYSLVYRWIQDGFAPPLTSLGLTFSFATCFQSLFFAMWFDMERNKDLR